MQGASSLTARTPQHASGPGDVVVTVAGRSGTLPNGFRFEAPSASTNQPPIIRRHHVAQHAGQGAPRLRRSRRHADRHRHGLRCGDAGRSAALRVDRGRRRLLGHRPRGHGRAPAQATTPAEVRLGLAVVETYQTVNAQGCRSRRSTGSPACSRCGSTHRPRRSATWRSSSWSTSRSSGSRPNRSSAASPTRAAARRPSSRTSGATSRSSRSRATASRPNPPVDVAFGSCRDRDRFGDACAYVPVRWESTRKSDGRRVVSFGTDQVNAVYENSRWRCATATSSAPPP